MKDDKTFIANIRCDYRYIAKIATFLASKGIFMGTKAKVASEAVRVLAHSIPDNFSINDYKDAVVILRKIGYEDDLLEGKGYYNKLKQAINLEVDRTDAGSSMEDLVRMHMKAINDRKVRRLDKKEISDAADIIQPVEDLEVKEKSAVKEIKKTFGNADGAPVSEE